MDQNVYSRMSSQRSEHFKTQCPQTVRVEKSKVQCARVKSGDQRLRGFIGSALHFFDPRTQFAQTSRTMAAPFLVDVGNEYGAEWRTALFRDLPSCHRR